MTQAKKKPVRVTKEIIAQREAERASWMNGLYGENRAKNALRFTPELKESHKGAIRNGTFPDTNAGAAKGAVLYVPKNQQKPHKQLYQDEPREKNDPKYIKAIKTKGLPDDVDYRSYTHSYESYKCAADKYAGILEMNNRLPTKQILWKLLRVLTPKEIRELRNGVFRYLRDKGLEAITNIELTRDPYGNKTSRVHLHILTDDTRTNVELENLVIKPCKRRGLVEDEGYTVSCNEIPKPETIFDYFTKHTRTDKDECERMGWKRVILFEPKLGLHKFREIKRGTWFREKMEALWKKFIKEKHGKDKE